MFKLIFFTSSKIKLAHARHLLKETDIEVVGFKEHSYMADYIEPRISNRMELLKISYEGALDQAKKAKLNLENPFILEDTSVNIYALSKKYGKETPGLDIKYWMKEISFNKLDSELKSLGNNRVVEVRSDLIVHIPIHLREKYGSKFLHFTGKVFGKIINNEILFNTQSLYPWLDNKTFNKWFCPADQTKPISMLDIKTADRYDFRKSCFNHLINFLNNEGLLNSRKPYEPRLDSSIILNKNIILVGLQCTGKTTSAQYMCDTYDYFHIEASDFMHLMFRKLHSVKSDIPVSSFAMEMLARDPVAIAREVVEFIEQYNVGPVVITGYRMIKEVDYTRECLSYADFECYFIKSSTSARKDRFIIRNRGQEESFTSRDERESKMGVGDMKTAYNCINNSKEIPHLFNKIDQTIFSKWNYTHTPKAIVTDLFEKILIALDTNWTNEVESEFFTTTEISKLINSSSNNIENSKHKDNISRFFNQKDYVFFDVHLINGRKKYRLSNTGRSMAKLICKKQST
ncbi:non-canonical purine NTP pyrophosphatase [Nitrincola iocasae]|uniref:Uncharacterized protein n=1 Tax=Nitrincola iocasae TaxID=2614693 RepID=A0A5J6L9R2_9GAMM|nr:non-canonical purine NTP pyrophosphatase [Nitrincola iocasae]QEW05273.1 hypothetical protein F5I99_01505 [Nitrincola iocasae]